MARSTRLPFLSACALAGVLHLAACGSTQPASAEAGAPPPPTSDSGPADAAAEAVAPPDAADALPAPDAQDARPPDAADAARRGADGDWCAEEADCQSAGHTLGAGFSSCEGAPNGYCRSFCTSPPAPQAGAPLEQRDCPSGSVCLPTYMATGFGFCLRACTADSECRVAEGYYCRRRFLTVETAGGVCAPAHCRSRGCAGADCSC